MQAQQSVTHHEIRQEVKPSEKLELIYSNTGFGIEDFIVTDNFTMLFSQYAQTLYLLENASGLIVDKLALQSIDKLQPYKASLRFIWEKQRKVLHYDRYIRGYKTLDYYKFWPVNDTLWQIGYVKTRDKYLPLMVWIDKNHKIAVKTGKSYPADTTFKAPELDKKIYKGLYFQKGYRIWVLKRFPYPEASFMLIKKSPWKARKNNSGVQSIHQSYKLYEQNSDGQWTIGPSLNFKNYTAAYALVYHNNCFVVERWYADKIIKINFKGELDSIPFPQQYNNQNLMFIDRGTDQLYLITDSTEDNITKNQGIEIWGGQKPQTLLPENTQIKPYELYRFNEKQQKFIHQHHIRFTGHIAQKLHNLRRMTLSGLFRMHNGTLYINIPIYTPAEQCGIYRLHLNQNSNNTIIHTPSRKTYSMIKIPKQHMKYARMSLTMSLDKKFHLLPRRFGWQINADIHRLNKPDSIPELTEVLKKRLENSSPRTILTSHIAWDTYALHLLKNRYTNKADRQKALNGIISEWKKPLQKMITAIEVAAENVVIEQKKTIRHYTTPDGWRCAFVKIKDHWYLYYQFHKMEGYHSESRLPELPSINKPKY